MLRILLFGLPGSGKTTIALEIAKKYGVCLIKTGEILRLMAKDQDEVGQNIKKSLDSGEMVDDRIVAQVVKSRLQQSDCQNGFVMDGYPRQLSQISEFDPEFDRCFYLEIPEKVAWDRLSGRGREDDTQTIISRRLEIAQVTLMPLINHYKKLGKLINIDASKNIEGVLAQIEGYLK